MAETLPPLTASDIRGPLGDTTFSVYLYIGNEEDKGWKYARLVFGLMAQLRIYLVKDIALIQEWVGSEKPSGVVFGWDDKVARLLRKDEAEDLETVLDAVTRARGPQ